MQDERIFIGLGSNLGDRTRHLREALDALASRVGRLVGNSALFASPAWGFDGLPFLNQVVEVRSELQPAALLKVLLQIEADAGRTRHHVGYANRVLDLDLLYYGNRCQSRQQLTLPHPEIPQRRFVLAPLAALAPEWKDPASGLTVEQLLAQCPDPTGTWA